MRFYSYDCSGIAEPFANTARSRKQRIKSSCGGASGVGVTDGRPTSRFLRIYEVYAWRQRYDDRIAVLMSASARVARWRKRISVRTSPVSNHAIWTFRDMLKIALARAAAFGSAASHLGRKTCVWISGQWKGRSIGSGFPPRIRNPASGAPSTLYDMAVGRIRILPRGSPSWNRSADAQSSQPAIAA
jgi:hypothetical protein